MPKKIPKHKSIKEIKELRLGNKIIDYAEFFEEEPDLKGKHGITLKHYINEWERFIKICEHLCKKRIYPGQGEKEIQLISYNENTGFEWKGTGGSTIPTLGKFMQLLNEAGIFSYGDKQKTKAMRAVLTFFRVKPLTNSNIKFLSLEYEELDKHDRLFSSFHFRRDSLDS